jgi:hypothetical protein
MRTVERRIVVFDGFSADNALNLAIKCGRNSELVYDNDAGGKVHLEFVGVEDLMHLGSECADNEVWYEIGTMLLPNERKSSLIPHAEELSAIKLERRK